jgi:hypothetical protein
MLENMKNKNASHSRSFSIITAATLFLRSRVCALEFSTTPMKNPLEYRVAAPAGDRQATPLIPDMTYASSWSAKSSTDRFSDVLKNFLMISLEKYAKGLVKLSAADRQATNKNSSPVLACSCAN